MKIVLILALAISTTLSITPQIHQYQTFDQQNLVTHLNTKQKHWKAGLNIYFQNMTLPQIKTLMGALPTPPHLKSPTRTIQPLKVIPDNFSSIQRWPNCVSIKQIRDQSHCGSCWALSAVQVMSDRICIQSGQRLQVRISAQDLLSCCGINCGNGCAGGYTDGAFFYWKHTGIVTGGNYDTKEWCSSYSLPPCDHHTQGKYEPCGQTQKSTPKCTQKCNDNYPKPYKQDKWYAELVYIVPQDDKKIQTEILTYGPVTATFTVYTDFLTYKEGIYHHISGSKIGKHAIKIIGWGVENGVKYWEVANSWNQDWGENGFFKIVRGQNQCHIEQEASGAIPKMKE